MKKCFFMVLISSTLFSSPIHAKTMYVTDNLVITVRKKPGLDYRVVSQLTSNEKVEILKTENSWAQISYNDNKIGWVVKRFLTEKIPGPIQIAALKKTVKKIEDFEKENRALKPKNAEMEERISSLLQENQKLKEEPYRILAGAGIFLMGCIVTLIILKVGRMEYDINNVRKRILKKKYPSH